LTAALTSRLLWRHQDGRASVWAVSAAGVLEGGREFGPFAGWSATALASGQDGRSRLLWNHVDGRASLWSLSSTAAFESGVEFGPFPGWSARGVAVGGDGKIRLLWRHVDGVRRCGF
jgi:hypothetical protein